MIINFEETNKAIAANLKELKRPIHYREARAYTVWSQNGNYSPLTDPDEKIRQYYGERHNGKGISFVKGGHLVLDYWFPSSQPQLSLLPPPEKVIIKGNCIVSYQAGYEQALRQQHYKDHYGDGKTAKRAERRRRAALVEGHLKYYIQHHWPQFYKSASNEGQYKKPAVDDCSIITPFHRLVIDIKTPSYEGDNGYDVTVIRNPKDNIIYIKGDWLNDETVIVEGVIGSSWAKSLGFTGSRVYHLSENHLWSIDALFVLLNMATQNQNYADFHRNLER